MKKYNIVLFLFLILFVFGCAKKNDETGQASDERQGQENMSEQTQNRSRAFESLIQAEFSDLKEGVFIMVLGSQNSDQSINASRIVIGDNASSFEDLAPGPVSFQNNKQEPLGDERELGEERNFGANQNQSNRGGFDISRFENMTEEEREQMRQQMSERRNLSSGPAFSGQISVSGQVVKFDEKSIVIKLEEGSKIIFFSDATFFNFAKKKETQD